MNPAIETMFGPEGKLCACGLEVIHQQPSKTIQSHESFRYLLALAPAMPLSFFYSLWLSGYCVHSSNINIPFIDFNNLNLEFQKIYHF